MKSYDPYCYPGTRILKNKFNLRDQKELDRRERYWSNERGNTILTQSAAKSADEYKNIHGRLFGKIYDWAGKYRFINMSKGTSAFCEQSQIPDKMDALFKDLKLSDLKQSSENDIFDKLGQHIEGLNYIHPFREGNGRTMRVHVQQLANELGHPIANANIPQDRWMNASIYGFTTGDHSDLSRVLREAKIDLPEAMRNQPLKSELKEFKDFRAMLYSASRESPLIARDIIERTRDEFKTNLKTDNSNIEKAIKPRL